MGFLFGVVTCFVTLTATDVVAEGGGATATVSLGGSGAGAADGAGSTGDAPDRSGAALGSPAPCSSCGRGRESTANVAAATMLAPSTAAPTNSHVLATRGAGCCAERATACTLANVPTAPGSEGAPGSVATNVAPSPKLGELSGRGVVTGVRRLERGPEKPGALIGYVGNSTPWALSRSAACMLRASGKRMSRPNASARSTMLHSQGGALGACFCKGGALLVAASTSCS